MIKVTCSYHSSFYSFLVLLVPFLRRIGISISKVQNSLNRVSNFVLSELFSKVGLAFV